MGQCFDFYGWWWNLVGSKREKDVIWGACRIAYSIFYGAIFCLSRFHASLHGLSMTKARLLTTNTDPYLP
jgi:hypothetical protein